MKTATQFQRIIHFIVDLFVVVIFYVVIAIVISKTFMETGKYLISSPVFDIGVIYFLYYLIAEYFFRRTVGKYLTKCRVVGYDGKAPTFKHILIRTFTRLLIIEIISFFSKEPIGWHDDFSLTKVVQKYDRDLKN